jgi:hypothetical protein
MTRREAERKLNDLLGCFLIQRVVVTESNIFVPGEKPAKSEKLIVKARKRYECLREELINLLAPDSLGE